MHYRPNVPCNKDSSDCLENSIGGTFAVASFWVEIRGDEGAKIWTDYVEYENDYTHVRINLGISISAAFFCLFC